MTHMKDRIHCLGLVIAGMLSVLGCSEDNRDRLRAEVAPTARKTVVWLSEEGVDPETADRLAAVGVDEFVVRRGTIRLSGAAPVVQLLPAPPVEGPIPTAVALEVHGLLVR